MTIYRKKGKKKKEVIPMKMVRINDKTVIEVDATISDEKAKENYMEKLKNSEPLKQKGFGRSK